MHTIHSIAEYIEILKKIRRYGFNGRSEKNTPIISAENRPIMEIRQAHQISDVMVDLEKKQKFFENVKGVYPMILRSVAQHLKS